jgi:hypothetical protein
VNCVKIQKAEAKRKDEPISLFQEDPEKFCIGDQVEGQATLADNSKTRGIKWEIRKSGLISDTVVASGAGRTFTNQTLTADSEHQVIFYCDMDRDGSFDDGILNIGAEPSAKTAKFDVNQVEDFSLTVRRHADTVYTGAAVDSNLSAGSLLLRQKNRLLTTGGDVRCCVNYQRSGPLGTFGMTGDGLDVITTAAELNTTFAQSGDIKVVTSIVGNAGNPVCNATGVVLGCGTSGGSLIITTGAASDVWMHEWGHVRGLPHRDSDPRNIMHSTAPNTDSINETECTAFEP